MCALFVYLEYNLEYNFVKVDAGVVLNCVERRLVNKCPPLKGGWGVEPKTLEENSKGWEGGKRATQAR